MSEQIIQLKIGPRVSEWILGDHGDGMRSLKPLATDNAADNAVAVIGHGVDQVVSATAKEKAHVFSWNRKTGEINRWHGEQKPFPTADER